ncbi:MAG TPA: 1-deoxy-D-xylulose-5-phosphate synthase N-terminal domain-containing protein [Acidimicrobiales bacterium]|nr:1-deoxy-D-xylulose-5-phosphate synthase N-terminal domain-containing protein [Acidimicrobiales bacterium]
MDTDVLERIQARVLWLAARIVDTANHDRPNPSGVKVGGHQASSASIVSIMTALWFDHLSGADKVAVKPHASPVYHAIKYLTGELDRSYLTTLRQRDGLQAYPSRTKDPDVSDFSTGSVGLGAVAPVFASAARRYVDAHYGDRPGERPRFVALVGDAELDEGNIWEAIADPALAGLGDVMIVVDVNRQSLDRVVPGMKIRALMEQFASAGWHVVEAKYGHRLQDAFARPGGEALRRHIDDMPNERYQSLFGLRGADLRARFLDGAPDELVALCDPLSDDELRELVTNLGGHDLRLLVESYRECDAVTDRPSIVFAYTVKGWGLPIAGDPLNHAALLTPTQIDELRAAVGLTPDTEWDRFDPDSPEGRRCAEVGGELNNPPPVPRPPVDLPIETRPSTARAVSSQETLGRVLTALADAPDGHRIVTTSPDVSISTNLGGWINKVGVFAAEEQPDLLGEGRLLRWQQGPSGRHLELGISEMNLFLLLGALGLAHHHHGEQLLPVGTVYDPFVCRGLDALIYALYNDARFVVVGTPAGITLAPEGGAHQSTITPSIGLGLPGLTYCEPAYAQAVDWLLCDGLAGLARPDGSSLYLRLSTRPLDQGPFAAAAARLGDDELRRQVLAGGYVLREAERDLTRPLVHLAASGPVLPEVLTAADRLADEGVAARVVDVTSLDRLYRGWRDAQRSATRTARAAADGFHLAELMGPAQREAPIVTVHDATTHAMAWLGSVFGQRVVTVGVDEFGQSGSVEELYEIFGLLPDQIAAAALVALG